MDKELNLIMDCFRTYDIINVVPSKLQILYTNIITFIDKR